AGPPSSLRSNPSRQLWQPVLIALALIPAGPPSSLRSNPSRQLWQPVLIALALIPAGPPSSLRSNPSKKLWQPVLIALALLPVKGAYFQQENKKGRNKRGEKGKCLHKGRERKGDNTNKSEKWSKEGTHLDRATTGDRIWKEINMFSQTSRFTPSMTAHQGNNGQSRQRQARMLLLIRPIQGNLTLLEESKAKDEANVEDTTYPGKEDGLDSLSFMAWAKAALMTFSEDMLIRRRCFLVATERLRVLPTWGSSDPMESLSPQVVAVAKLPIFNPNEFDLWKMRIKQYFLMTDYSLWEVILYGDSPTPTRIVDGVVQCYAYTQDYPSS
nr:ribonuclease H-like domain-containing protein [Tanacetum cinerariifolium]